MVINLPQESNAASDKAPNDKAASDKAASDNRRQQPFGNWKASPALKR